MKYVTSIIISAISFLTISCSSSHRGGEAKMVLASKPTEEQLRVENANRMRIGLRLVNPCWSFDASNRTFKGSEVWIVATPDDPNCKKQVLKVVKRQPDGTTAEELDYYYSGRYYPLGKSSEHGIHDEFFYLKYSYPTHRLSLHYVGDNAEMERTCQKLAKEKSLNDDVIRTADALLKQWKLSRL